jgi:hypothetical protein
MLVIPILRHHCCCTGTSMAPVCTYHLKCLSWYLHSPAWCASSCCSACSPHVLLHCTASSPCCHPLTIQCSSTCGGAVRIIAQVSAVLVIITVQWTHLLGVPAAAAAPAPRKCCCARSGSAAAATPAAGTPAIKQQCSQQHAYERLQGTMRSAGSLYV